MSQFLLVISEDEPVTKVPSITFVRANDAQQVFSDVVDYYQIPPDQAWAVLDETGDTTDSIFASAGCDISQGDALSSTELGKLLGELIYSGVKLVAWYACEFEDLEHTFSVVEVIEHLNQELPVGSGEIYIAYR